MKMNIPTASITRQDRFQRSGTGKAYPYRSDFTVSWTSSSAQRTLWTSNVSPSALTEFTTRGTPGKFTVVSS